MDNVAAYIEHLKDSNLVWEIQQYFGIRKVARVPTIRVTNTYSSSINNQNGSEKTENGQVKSRHHHQKSLSNGYVSDHLRENKPFELEVSKSKTVGGGVTPVSSDSGVEETVTDSDSGDSHVNNACSPGSKEERFVITNKFWYYLFCFGTALGDETFYASFFPFWFWNIDGAVGRRVVMVWVMIMYIGQGLKDVICWPRPFCPPAVRLEKKWALEFGMPSTHAMVGLSVPFSVLYYTMYRYEAYLKLHFPVFGNYSKGVSQLINFSFFFENASNKNLIVKYLSSLGYKLPSNLGWAVLGIIGVYPVYLGVAGSCLWCVVVCYSRIYMGMHTVLDIYGGLLLAVGLLSVFLPMLDGLDNLQLTNPYAPFVVIGTIIFLAVMYPAGKRWTPARGDTTIILGVGAGCSFGSWLNYQLGIICGPPMPPPYQILWPTYEMIGLTLLRTCIGILIVVATRAFFRSVSYIIVCWVLRLDPKDVENKQKIAVELSCKFITYALLGFNACYLAPVVFRFLKIERATMFTEV